MAAFVVSSRFSGLKIEDDDSPPNSLQQKAKKDKSSSKKAEPVKKTNIQPAKPQTAAKKKKKQTTLSTKQWEQWKQKDEELVDENYEDELQQAILLSKLDFEEKKDVYKKIKKDTEKQKLLQEQVVKLKNKQMKKKNVMSLDQFNNGGEAKCTTEDDKESNEEAPKSPVKDTKFFERIKSEAKDELLKDKNIDRVKNRLTSSDEEITRVQFIDTLEKKDKEIAELRQELSNLKQELFTTKSRNKKLCQILGHGEMKDKAEVLIEVERLRSVQGELTAELATLHTDLERARSMNSDTKTKDKKNGAKKKNIRFDVSSEALLAKDASSGTGG